MKKPLCRALLGSVLVWVGLVCPGAGAQEEYLNDDDYEIASLFKKSTEAMEEQDYDRALFYLNRVIEVHGKPGVGEQFGPKLGVMYYRKGFCSRQSSLGYQN